MCYRIYDRQISHLFIQLITIAYYVKGTLLDDERRAIMEVIEQGEI